MPTKLFVAATLSWGLVGSSRAGHAETISSALSRAYMGNPDLNQQRAAGRASDETVSRAVSGFRPQVSGTASLGYNNEDATLSGERIKGSSFPTAAGLTVTQTIFNGNQTVNGVRQAESGVLQARETIRNTEQNTLQNGATAYMNVLRDTAILDLNKNNITVLEEQLRQTRDRFNVGEVTRTDVAQAESSLATARSNYFTAQANLQNSVANFRQIIGVEPKRLEAARPIDALLPSNLQSAITVALSEHPAIQAAFHNVDVAQLQVQVQEGQLYPTVNVVGNVQQNNQYQGAPNNRLFNASVLAQLSVPIYTGGAAYAQIRQAKELLSQARLQADLQRDIIRATVVSSWGQLETAKAVIRSSQAAVKSSEIALDGVREEAKVGQRTTLDVLIAQQTLLNARVNLVSAQRDRVVASYVVMAASGRLSAANLALNVVQYDPTIHYDQVKDKWIGLRTPDGQ
ncbi:TolC family outer membrane protein [Beijerinckia sp. L45]|uniref:TolC family outer membrane protein n=1 Tax=Beijerinckia sp. L45 TaxID=1641855 RepID=UPI001FEFEDA7|nr:TolC family outer membrane protein [Beijerinckia sp. L45]